MLHFFLFILLFIIILIVFVIVGFLGIFKAVFGRKFKKTVKRRSEQAAEAQPPRPKVFDDDEGEYVEYEEIQDEKKPDKNFSDFNSK